MVLPENARITARALKDLEKLLKRDPKNFARVWEDLKRLSQGALPQPPKSLKGFHPPLWQVDSGDFRIFHTWDGDILWIRGVPRKPEPAKRIRASH
ncbi:MAG: hypothetical protein HY611_03470 [Elusimicrobia bacterium]|nr:hypothetical protein [Elusimicrobiota bacterium]